MSDQVKDMTNAAQGNTETAQSSTQNKEAVAQPQAEQKTLLAEALDKALSEKQKQSPVEEAKKEEPKTKDNSEQEESKEQEDEDQGAPEAYEDFQVPEGVVLDPETTDQFKSLAKELNLSQSKSQKFVDLATKHTEKVAKATHEQITKQWDAARKDWIEKGKNDPEFGGAKYKEGNEHALRAMSAFGDDELREVLETGVGDNHALRRFFARVGMRLAEGKPVESGARTDVPKSAAKVIYENMSVNN